MPDQTLVCRDCNAEYVFTEGEQAFYQEKGFSAPIRCSECRRRRKAEKMSGGSYGGGNSYGGGGRGQSRGW